MHLSSGTIKPETMVGEIVSGDYRTADVFKKFGIEYYCGAKRTLQQACEMTGLDVKEVETELNNVIRNIRVSSTLDFSEWPVDFLVEYIQKLHHSYLKQAFPDVLERLERFVPGHKNKYPHVAKVLDILKEVYKYLITHIDAEEKTIFPYVRQVNNALKNSAEYGSLLVRTLRKPIDKTIVNEQGELRKLLYELRLHSNDYSIDGATCLSYNVIMQKIREIDCDLAQYIYIEHSVLLPKVTYIENELLRL
jgi:regulator of cell morphogenesis and NO signaling